MALSRPDVLIRIHYCDKHPENVVIMTNARTEALDELLSAFLQDCMFGNMTGLPRGPLVERDHYEVKIGYWLDGDGFSVESDAGDAYLTVGLTAHVLGSLAGDKLTIVGLLPDVG